MFGLFPRKGTIAIGSDADIVLWDPSKTVTLTNALMHHGGDYTPYEGMVGARLSGRDLCARHAGLRRQGCRRRPGFGEHLARAPYDYIKPNGIFPTPFNPVDRHARRPACLQPPNDGPTQPRRATCAPTSISRRRFMRRRRRRRLIGSPSVLRAQTKEIFVGGPASPGLQDVLFPVIEKKHGFKILFEGTNSLINLQKIQQQGPPDHDGHDDGRSGPHPRRAREADREAARPTSPTSPTCWPTRSRAARMWANWCQPMCSASHNTKSVPNGARLLRGRLGQEVQGEDRHDLDAHHAGDRAAGRGARASRPASRSAESMKEWQARASRS